MTRILDRYIFREITMTWFGVTMVLLLILLTNQFARVLGDVAKGKLPKDAAFDVIGLSAAQYLTILVPIGLFLSIMLALGRLYRDSEMPAMMACRVGPSGIYRPMMWLLVPLAAGVAWLSVEGAPLALTAIDRIGAEARREADLASIEPGRFTVFGPDQAVVYGERVTDKGEMEKVFMQRLADDGRVEVVIAERGEQLASDDTNIRMLVLHNGRRYEGIPGTTRFRVVEFAEHGIPYQLPSLRTAEPRPRAMSFSRLRNSRELEHIAEMQWRVSIPLATIILAMLAVPLSRSQPRSGRYGRLAIGLLVFIIYLNMLSAAKAWIEQATISPSLGLWWVHGCALLLTLGLLAFQNGWHRRLWR
ncbi:MAG: LPS export ABC transporter permease LptF [Gammaproteobacteria bacterium]|nr:LPS export ABC transporter permease LptF [Gammaproteobacteria bacterium]MDH3480967.1 LPS export ABC transporter permease LptF [Gammaproteobacteria bacterium]